MTERREFGWTRTACACKACVRNCEVMPGFLIPADLDRMIPPFFKPLAWAETNLLASPGALVMKGLETFRIPTLVPKTKENGECVYLLPDRSCAIHQVSPFGCAFFDCGPERGLLSHKGLTAVYRAWLFQPKSLYRQIWEHLFGLNLVQIKAETLRARMRDAQ